MRKRRELTPHDRAIGKTCPVGSAGFQALML
jgi:hypothetical protein